PPEKRFHIVTTLHGTDITIVGQDPSFAPVVNYSINESDGVTSVSEYLRRETHNYFAIERDIEVIPNFIDTGRFRRLNKQHFKQVLCPENEKVMVHVSNFRPVKRVIDVVHVFNRLIQKGLKIKLLLVGDGPDRMQAQREVNELRLNEHVRFLGKQEPVEEILSIADVFMIPSGSETFGLAALEAMACNVPVVASDIGGLPELVVDGESGFLCPLGDIEAFTERCYQLLTEDALHATMAESARRRAVEVFDIERIVPHYEAYYRRVREPLMARALT
ncbi:MAG: N-acetyl-alpha-D-glucosaminyl L-malate synthase BshA, partial [Rhodothermales bacterium]